MRPVVVIGVLAMGCGRVGFENTRGGSSVDAEVPFVEPMGRLDLDFASPTFVQPSGKIALHAVLRRANGYLAVGARETPTGNRIALVGTTDDGEADATFGGDGTIDIGPTTNDFGYGAARIDGNRILLAGDGDDMAGPLDDLTLGIIDDAGAVSPAFGTNGFVRVDVRGLMRNDTANRAIAVAGGHLVACGNHGYDAPDAKVALLKLDLAGNRVTGFGTNGEVVDDYAPNGFDECSDIVEHGSNVIVVGEGNGTRFAVAAYRTSDGARDPAFATGGVFTLVGNATAARAVAIADGDIIAAGKRDGMGLVVRLASDGTRRTTFGTNGEVALADLDSVTDLAVQPNGKVLAVGADADLGHLVIVRLLSDGTLDETFASAGRFVTNPGGGTPEVRAMLLEADGHIVVVLNIGTTARIMRMI